MSGHQMSAMGQCPLTADMRMKTGFCRFGQRRTSSTQTSPCQRAIRDSGTRGQALLLANGDAVFHGSPFARRDMHQTWLVHEFPVERLRTGKATPRFNAKKGGAGF